jgi:hypothetical protein
MFPLASFDPTRILPLTSNEFILRILVPEVALRLIMEDRDLDGDDGVHQALVVLRESSTYGVAMFPEDGGGGSTGKKRRDDAMCVGDKIVMERARKRRKELEEEEEQEEREEARRIAEMEAGVEMQVKKMGGKKQKGKQREEQQQTRDKVRKPSSTRAKSSDPAVLSIGSDSDASLGSQRSTKSAVRRSSRKKAIERSDSMDMDIYGGDEDDVNSEVENFLDIKTPVHKHSRSSDHRGAKDFSNDERTPKPLLFPLIGGSNDNIKPLMIARTRQSQKNSE